MIIIGVTGKSGAGKTTFSDFLGKRDNVGVIHLDKVVDDVKESKFKNQIRERNKNNGPVMFSNKVHIVINNNKFLFRAFCTIKKFLMKDKIKEEIARFKREGKDAVVIDSCYLTDLVDEKLFDKIICVKRPYKSRLDSIVKREKESEEKIDLVTRDMPYKRKISKARKLKYDYVILNTLGKDELERAGEKIYDEVVGIKTFDEWIKVPKKDDKLKAVRRSNPVTKIIRTSKLRNDNACEK